MSGSAGVASQPPDIDPIGAGVRQGFAASERARYLDLAIEQRATRSLRWQAAVFTRKEADTPRDESSGLRGSAWGVELLADRRTTRGLSGWVAYSFGKARYTDKEHREAFWADLDQRHALTLFGTYRVSDRASVGATFRAGSNFPVPGSVTSQRGGLLAGSRSNQMRLPPYVRLDVRGERGFDCFGRHLTAFVEVLNVLNRTNYGLTSGEVGPNGEATGFGETLPRRRVTGGVVIQF